MGDDPVQLWIISRTKILGGEPPDYFVHLYGLKSQTRHGLRATWAYRPDYGQVMSKFYCDLFIKSGLLYAPEYLLNIIPAPPASIRHLRNESHNQKKPDGIVAIRIIPPNLLGGK